jgi:hypothetical protein
LGALKVTAKEQDTERLLELVRQLNQMLDDKERRLKGQTKDSSNCSLSPASLFQFLKNIASLDVKGDMTLNQVSPIPRRQTWLLKNPGLRLFPLEFRPSGSRKTKTPARTEHQPVQSVLLRTSSCASCMPRGRHSVSLGEFDDALMTKIFGD